MLQLERSAIAARAKRSPGHIATAAGRSSVQRASLGSFATFAPIRRA
jgi:hypothetical protein